MITARGFGLNFGALACGCAIGFLWPTTPTRAPPSECSRQNQSSMNQEAKNAKPLSAQPRREEPVKPPPFTGNRQPAETAPPVDVAYRYNGSAPDDVPWDQIRPIGPTELFVQLDPPEYNALMETVRELMINTNVHACVSLLSDAQDSPSEYDGTYVMNIETKRSDDGDLLAVTGLEWLETEDRPDHSFEDCTTERLSQATVHGDILVGQRYRLINTVSIR